MTWKITVAQIQIARADETNELDQNVGFAIRRCEQAALDYYFWHAAMSLTHPFFRDCRSRIDESHVVLTA
ncbi:hypothetical protein ANRL4_01406 [Anaerolineae bacterium]|nr:hypothetical protein ANRL4_01406 [Anaerolineae bacterium]